MDKNTTIAVKLKSLFIPDSHGRPDRRFDLDWLRILAFAFLIFFHVGMLYTANWGYHVKSQYLSETLESIMLLVNPWRMPVLWMISGIAIRFILAKVSLARFITIRSYRLLLPLLFGILVIVPPQLYYEMAQNGDMSLSYWSFYSQFFDLDNPIFANYSPGIWHHIDVNHLWYLRELWTFSLYLIFLLPLLNWHRFYKSIDWLAELNGYLLVAIITLPIFIIQLTVDDNRELLGFTFLLYGYLIGWQKRIWQRLKANTTRLLLASLICYVALVIFYNLVWTVKTDETNQFILAIGTLVHSFERILWVMTLLGLAHRFLNKSSRYLNYFNQAVYPYYILHQTIIIAVGYEISSFQFGPVFEPLIVILATFAICGLSFEVIRRVDWLHPFFGLKIERNYPRIVHLCSSSVAAILVLGIGLEILI